ncbi:MAG TPA: hypothetical protein VNS52_01550 [Gemmatimonadaceae bacterium]|nr:hypothetical protein [Gemmatimonadaceae bacterium]
MHGPEILVPLAFFAMIAIIGRPIVQALASRMEQKSAGPRVPSDVTARLERMEQALDSIAVEVERISEGQRFTTKLLAERSADGAHQRVGQVAAGGDR